MMTRRWPSLLVAAALGVAAVFPTAAFADSPKSANECVHVLHTEMADGMSYAVNNACDEPLTCRLSWTLRCSNAAGKVTKVSSHADSFQVDATKGHDVFASAADCNVSWEVASVTWSCNKQSSSTPKR